MPNWAPRPVATMTAIGVARPRAHGHAMTSTASPAATARSTGPPASSHAPTVTTAIATTTGTKTPATRSARRWALALPV
ncbi:Uncharacterised protein [Mycobacteroides abscessus subsp. abscessus]|nr:Uncharacterised protein [Mycobacteroides abscessus subsp. abscessus]